jgi:hypothetical protein
VNDDQSDSDGAEKYVRPCATGERRRPDNQGDPQERLEEATPVRPVLFEASEVEMAEHQATRGDGYVEPVGISAPHEKTPQRFQAGGERLGGYIYIPIAIPIAQVGELLPRIESAGSDITRN